jgi:hypothetical protein
MWKALRSKLAGKGDNHHDRLIGGCPVAVNN